MARFNIIPKNGVNPEYSGTPTFTGTYMKPGMLEFREVASPSPINWTVGDYVTYTRTGFTYRLYNVPQLKKQARRNSYGGAFVYQNVQFYDDSKQLEFCPFRDLVTGDNRIHFSTQPSISTYEPVDGLARRFEACLEDMYGVDSWVVRVATAQDGASTDLINLMAEARDFTVSGVNILQCLDKIYEIWPDVGWVYTIENETNTIIIGGGGLKTNTGSYAYGKGNGLKSISRTVANADELGNRLFAYGSSRNMLPGWYNNQNIKDAESVDIRNLMLPVDAVGTPGQSGYYPGWGKTSNLPDASKAYIEDTTSKSRLGLRPRTVYFDGSGDYPEIYPTLRNVTIGKVRGAMLSTDQYYPKPIYNDSERVDLVLSAQETYDSGLAGEDGKSASVTASEVLSNDTGNGSVEPASNESHTIATRSYTMTKTNLTDITLSMSGSGTITTQGGNGSVYLNLSIQKGDGTTFSEIKRGTYELTGNANNEYEIRPVTCKASEVSVFVGDIIRVYLTFTVVNTNGEETLYYTYDLSPNMNFSAAWSRKKTFTISIRQIGFDIEAQATLGSGKTIAMLSGSCVGRSFAIKNVQYNSITDVWDLECYRSEDESLSQWFPNTDSPVRGLEDVGGSNEYPGDEFVLLDIAMPGTYVKFAEQDLLVAAKELLADIATERWQYNPEIDAKYMVENSRVIRSGEYMTITDTDLLGVSPEAVLVDTITINEGESAIPTYKVTLRDRKRKTWTESSAPVGITSKPVSGSTQEDVQSISGQVGDSYFTLDENGNVTLKSKYSNLWVPGWMSAGGIGSGGGGGGGGGSDVSWGDESGHTVPLTVNGVRKILLMDGALNGYALTSSIPTALSQLNDDPTHRVVTDEQINAWNNSGGVSSVTISSGTGISVSNSGVPITDVGSRTISISTTYQNRINHGETAYGWGDHHQEGYLKSYTETDPTVPAWAKQSSLQFSALPALYVGKTPVKGNNTSNDTLIGINGFTTGSSASASGDTSLVVWDPDAGGIGIGAWHFKGNIYADGWIAAGGIGDGGGGGGGVDLDRVWESLTNNTDKPDVKINVAHIPNITTSKITDLESWIASKGYLTSYTEQYTGTVTDVTLTQGTGITVSNSGTAITTSGARTISISSTYRNYISHGETAYGWGNHAEMGYLTQHQDLSGYALKTGADDYEFLVSQLKFSNGYLVGGSYNSTPRPQWKYSTTTKNIAYLDEIPTALKNPYSLTFGSKTYDGSAGRTILASDLDAVTLSDAQTISGAKTFSSVVTAQSIVIGQVTISYDPSAKALRISGTDNGTTVGFYCDGFVAAGGVQSS